MFLQRESARWVVGVLCLEALGAHASFMWQPALRVTAEERYGDAAILGTTTDGAAGQFISRLSLQPEVHRRNDTLNMNGWYAADILFRHGSGNLTVDHRANLNWTQNISRRLMLRASAAFWRVTDPTSLPRMGLARALLPMLYSRADAYAQIELKRNLSFRGNYRFEFARLLDAASPSGLYHAPSCSMFYSPGSRWMFGLEYRLQAFAQEFQQAWGNSGAAHLRFLPTRQSHLDVSAGPVYYVSRESAGWLPRVGAEYAYESNWGLVEINVGQDLVGASGFAAALWAQYVAFLVQWNARRDVGIFGAASFYRNGPAPAVDVRIGNSLDGAVSEGYRLGIGAEWKLSRELSLAGTVDRFQQVGSEIETANIAWMLTGIRLVFSPRLVR